MYTYMYEHFDTKCMWYCNVIMPWLTFFCHSANRMNYLQIQQVTVNYLNWGSAPSLLTNDRGLQGLVTINENDAA